MHLFLIIVRNRFSGELAFVQSLLCARDSCAPLCWLSRQSYPGRRWYPSPPPVPGLRSGMLGAGAFGAFAGLRFYLFMCVHRESSQQPSEVGPTMPTVWMGKLRHGVAHCLVRGHIGRLQSTQEADSSPATRGWQSSFARKRRDQGLYLPGPDLRSRFPRAWLLLGRRAWWPQEARTPVSLWVFPAALVFDEFLWREQHCSEIPGHRDPDLHLLPV